MRGTERRAQEGAAGTRHPAGEGPEEGSFADLSRQGGRWIWVVDPMNPIWLASTPKCELEVRGQSRPGDGSRSSGRKAPSAWAPGGGARESSLC